MYVQLKKMPYAICRRKLVHFQVVTAFDAYLKNQNNIN